MLTFLVIAIIEVFIIDISGVMQSLVHPLLKKLFNIKLPEADISFKTYRQLQKIVLE